MGLHWIMNICYSAIHTHNSRVHNGAVLTHKNNTEIDENNSHSLRSLHFPMFRSLEYARKCIQSHWRLYHGLCAVWRVNRHSIYCKVTWVGDGANGKCQTYTVGSRMYCHTVFGSTQIHSGWNEMAESVTSISNQLQMDTRNQLAK